MADPIENIEGYTYADYANWPEEFRCELVDGIIYMMAPPTIWHQEISIRLAAQLLSFLDGKTCRVIASPVGVRLIPKADDSDQTIFEPDIIVVCDSEKLSDGKTCRGAPDFLIEIISPSTKSHDLFTKKPRYAKAGVKECWFIDHEIVSKCILNNGSHTETTIHYLFDREPIPVDTLPGCRLTIPIIN